MELTGYPPFHACLFTKYFLFFEFFSNTIKLGPCIQTHWFIILMIHIIASIKNVFTLIKSHLQALIISLFRCMLKASTPERSSRIASPDTPSDKPNCCWNVVFMFNFLPRLQLAKIAMQSSPLQSGVHRQ